MTWMSARTDGTFLTRVVLRDYKSIAECDVRLGPLTFLVGPNGSGKSNFIDALRFVRDFMVGGLPSAFRARGGANEVVRRVRRPVESFAIELEFTAADGVECRYELEVACNEGRTERVRRERAWIQRKGGSEPWSRQFEDQIGFEAAKNPGGLSHVLRFGEEAGILHGALSAMSFYDPNPTVMREPIPRGASGEALESDGRNLGCVLEQMQRTDPARFARINEYLRVLLPELLMAHGVPVGTEEAQWFTVQFLQRRPGSDLPTVFSSRNMSDGTLRILALLVGVIQESQGPRSRLVGLEEPESAVHPGAVAVLLDAVRSSSRTAQILVATHSAEMLDDKEISADEILAVDFENGRTTIRPIGEAGRDVLNRRLYSVGELLRMGALRRGDSKPTWSDRVADQEG
ncbi:MAG: AAA family ATPase [Planctomycetes bacterium]|nr:AAA family ATPase [Planctomycetota bacterium]